MHIVGERQLHINMAANLHPPFHVDPAKFTPQAHPEQFYTTQFQLGRFRPTTMDRCSEPGCSMNPKHNRVAHHQPGFPDTLHTDQGGNPTLAAGLDASNFFDEGFHYPEQATQAIDMGRTSLWYGPNTMGFFSAPLAPLSAPATQATGSLSLTIPSKIDTSATSSAVLAEPLDSSGFVNIDDDDWRTCVGSSPATDDSISNGPLTPISPQDGLTHCGPSSQDVQIMSSFGSDTLVPSHAAVLEPDVSHLNLSHHKFPTLDQYRPYTHVQNQQADWSQALAAYQNHFAAHGTFHPVLHGLPTSDTTMYTASQYPSTSFARAPPLAAPKIGPLARVMEYKDAPASRASSVDDGSASTEDAFADQDGDHRHRRDAFLVYCRKKGMSYKEIKRQGRFTEAESTLRGRIRILTKDKDERVRRPSWQPHDIALLTRAMKKFAPSHRASASSSKDTHAKLHWKDISEWMKEHGGSYPFAAATCAKKWKALHT